MAGVVRSREDGKKSHNSLSRSCLLWQPQQQPQQQQRRWRIRMLGLLLCGFLLLVRLLYFWQDLSPQMDRMNTAAATSSSYNSSMKTTKKEEEQQSFPGCKEEEDQDERRSILEEERQKRHQRLSQRPLADPNSIHALLRLNTTTTTATTTSGAGGNAEPQPGQPHFLTTLSGCRMARWILGFLYEETKDPRRAQRSDCYRELQLDPSKVLSSLSSNSSTTTTTTTDMIQPYDTIYVTWEQLRDFVQDILPHLHQPILLLSGQRENVGAPSPSIIATILHHSMISYWFVQNMETYLLPALPRLSSPSSQSFVRHKVASFPYGLKQRADKDEILEPTHGPAYRGVFWESLQQQPQATHSNRSTRFFQGYVTVANNPRDRGGTGDDGSGSPVFLAPLEYYRQLADSDYVWSPNGDRPETYRHYEALGLGAAPVTQWNRQQGRFASSASCHHFDYPAYDHLLHTGLVYADEYNHTFANLADWMLRAGDVVVNRNVILEEYWMDYINVYTNQSWTWWNRYPSRKQKHANQDDGDDVYEKRGPITTHQLLGDLAASMES